jgi:hypothetical protein
MGVAMTPTVVLDSNVVDEALPRKKMHYTASLATGRLFRPKKMQERENVRTAERRKDAGRRIAQKTITTITIVLTVATRMGENPAHLI